MFQEIQQFVIEQLGKNDLIAGGAVLGAMSFLLLYLRKLPLTLIKWGRLLFVTHVDIPDRSQTFNWVNDWLSNHKYSKKSRRITVEGHGKTVKTTPAPGNHFIWWRGRPMIMNRVRREGTGDNAHRAFRESWSITIFGKRKGIESFIKECRSASNPEEATFIRVYEACRDYWPNASKKRKRRIDTIIMPEGMSEDLMKDVNKFISSESWYDEMSIPYRRGYLFTGPPGNGKSSIIKAIASEIDYSVHIINLRQVEEDDLSNLVRLVSSNSILLLEDIDCAFDKRKNTTGISMSSLLNLIDGVNAPEGRIVMMTTNKPEKLDPALVRPGRIDRTYHLPNATLSQSKRLFERFFPDSDRSKEFADKLSEYDLSMATLQGHLLKYKDSEKKAIKKVKEMLDG